MASMEPTEEEISQVIDFAGLSRDDDRNMVIQALKNNNRNVESVVMNYFDNPESFRQRFNVAWNDSMFTTDRDGQVDHGASAFHIEDSAPNPSFYIESMSNSMHQSDVIQGVTPPPDKYAPGAPSRPPSRSDAKSPLGRMVDLTASDVPRFVGQSDADQDMVRALRESAQEAGLQSGQESGVVGNASAPYFGPAMRSTYDHADWAMVPVAPADMTSNVLPASDRKRKTDAPAFLVQHPNTVGNHRLGGLITILHQIPLARNILLRSGTPSDAYGYDNEWWKGKGITPPQSAQPQTPTSDVEWGSDDGKPGFEEELHRLMAFLDSTERSYGSTSVLTELVPYPAVGPEKQFYEFLGQRNGEAIFPLTQVASLATVYGDDPGEEEQQRFGLIEIEHLRSDYNTIKTLYEVLDHLMWSDVLSWNELSEESKMAMFHEMGDVLAIKIGGEGPEEPFEIPTELYPERWLTSRKREAHRIQRAWCNTKRAMMRIAQEEQTLHQWRDDFGQISFNRKVKMEKASEQWKTLQKYLQSAGQFTGMQQSGYDTNRYPDYHEAPELLGDTQKQALVQVDDVLRLTDKVLADMGQRADDLNNQLEALKAKQRFLGRILTTPDKPGRPKPMTCKKYLLRGVATDKDIIYVCQRQQTDLIDLGDSPPSPDQWWRLAYAQGEEHPVKADKIEVEHVLEEVWKETKTPLFIYATEDAVNADREALSLPLERFVKADNKAFRQELNLEQTNEQDTSRHAFLDALSPSKRKHRSDSMDSLDSNRASLGSDEDNGFDNPFEEQPANFSFQREDYQTHSMGVDGLPIPGSIDAYRSDLAGLERDATRPIGSDSVFEASTNPDTAPPTYSSAVSHDTAQRPAAEPEMSERPRQPSFGVPAQEPTEAEPKAGAMDVELPNRES